MGLAKQRGGWHGNRPCGRVVIFIYLEPVQRALTQALIHETL